MTENRSKGTGVTTDKKEGVWGRYWIRSGLEVIHRNDAIELNIDRLHLFKMTVERVVKRSKGDGKNGERRVFIEGIRCHWVDNERKYQVGQFHTNELIPYEVAEQGIGKINEWIGRDFRV